MSDPIQQTTASKITTLCIGLCGVSMSLDKVASLMQPIGIIVGCVLVCGQAYVFFKGRYLNWKRRRPSNDC